MKQIVKLLTLMCRKAHLPAVMLLALLSGLAAHADVVINETTFPDANFRNFILSQTYGQDGVLTDAEIAEVDSINCAKMQIESLEGIGFFTALSKLYCSMNQLTKLNVSNNTDLTILSCNMNQLTELNIAKNVALKDLDVSFNQIKDIDLSQNINLITLNVSNNLFSSLDISSNLQLRMLNFMRNKIAEIDISKHNLTNLFCGGNLLTTLDLSNQTELYDFKCNPNRLTELDFSATFIARKRQDLLGTYCNFFGQTRDLTAESAVTSDGEHYYYLRLDDNTDNDQPIWARMTETNVGGVVSKFDPSRVLEWTSGGTIFEGQKRVATTANDLNPQNITGKILLLTDVTENPTTNTASGTVKYKYNVNNPRYPTGGNGDFTLNWTAPIPGIHTAVNDLRETRKAVGVTYTNLAGQSSDKPFDGINIVTTRYSDGTTNATKVIK